MGIVLNTLWSFMSKNVGGGSMFVVFKQKAVPATTAGTALKKWRSSILSYKRYIALVLNNLSISKFNFCEV
ncbi:MAG: hypothetical protein R2792_17420, partial [Saprospiraceae bacterium]